MSRRKKTMVVSLAVAATALGILITGLIVVPPAVAEAVAGPESSPGEALGLGLLAAAIATGAAAIGAGYAVGLVGSAAIGALAEKPELLGRALILVGLAEGIAIYGVLMSVLILNRI